MLVHNIRAYIMQHAPIGNKTVNEIQYTSTLTNDYMFGQYVKNIRVRKSLILSQPVNAKIVGDSLVIAFTPAVTQYTLEDAILKAIIFDRFTSMTFAKKNRLYGCVKNELLASKSELYIRVVDAIAHIVR